MTKSTISYKVLSLDRIVIQSYQQRRSEVKVLEELGDEDVDVDHAVPVHLLHLPQDVDQPLKVPLAARDPDKVQLQKNHHHHHHHHHHFVVVVVVNVSVFSLTSKP